MISAPRYTHLAGASCGRLMPSATKAVTRLGLNVNTSKTAIVCDWRLAAIAASAQLGVPTRRRGMYAGRNVGCDHAPLRQRKWRHMGSVLADQLRRITKRLKRHRVLRRATGPSLD